MEILKEPPPFFKRVVELCAKKGVSVSKMVEILGFGNSTAAHWKKGRVPNGIRLGVIAKYLDTTTDYLLTGIAAAEECGNKVSEMREPQSGQYNVQADSATPHQQSPEKLQILSAIEKIESDIESLSGEVKSLAGRIRKL